MRREFLASEGEKGKARKKMENAASKRSREKTGDQQERHL